MTKPVVKERGFLPTREDGDLMQMIQQRGWESVPLTIIRDFYANAKAEKNGFSVVRGIKVDYRPEAIRMVVGGKNKPRNAENWVLREKGTIDLDAIVYEMCVYQGQPGRGSWVPRLRGRHSRLHH